MSQHTPEPWRTEKNYWGDVNIIRAEHFFIGCTIVRGIPEPIPTQEEIEANTARIVACVNGCTGLNPTAYRECVEALKALLRYAIFVGTTEQFRTQAQHAVQHAEGKE